MLLPESLIRNLKRRSLNGEKTSGLEILGTHFLDHLPFCLMQLWNQFRRLAGSIGLLFLKARWVDTGRGLAGMEMNF